MGGARADVGTVLVKSFMSVLFLLRQNPVQEAAAELFGATQATDSRRWTALLPVVEKALTSHIPDPAEASADRIVLVDGTLVTTWDRASEGTSMFSGKHRDTGFNLQVAATLAGNLHSVSTPVPSSRHDIHARRESHSPDTFAEREGIGDLGYIGSSLITPRRKPPTENVPSVTRSQTARSTRSAPLRGLSSQRLILVAECQ
ncbi:transposase family protein [Streptomyces sp. NPDC058417]|uniref:transposase family protein n=1 Tax=unclassified Streptomyces TaxID=2593676 RepID=UPI0036529180